MKSLNFLSSVCLGLILAQVAPVVQGQIFAPPIPAVPASQLPSSYSQRLQTSPVNAALLRNRPSRKYFLDAGDVLGIFIEGVLGKVDEMPPVQIPDPNSDLPPSIGYPVSVRADGTISLPLIEPLSVSGLTIIQVEELIKSRYLDPDKLIIKPENRVMVSLMRKRTVSVYVIRGDESQSASLSRQRSGIVNQRSDQSRRSSRLQLPAGDNDLLNALSQTGGLPGVNARSDVKIYRGSQPAAGSVGVYQGGTNSVCKSSEFPRTALGGSSYARSSASGNIYHNRSNGYTDLAGPTTYSTNGAYMTTVPTRRRPGENIAIGPTDVRLRDGDVVVIEPRDTEVYYTGGLLGGGEFPLPRDRGIDVLEAIAAAGQSVGAAGRNGFSVIAQRTPTELLILRQRPGQGQLAIRVDVNRALSDPSQRVQVKAGDLLILRHSRREQIQNAGIGVLNAYGVRQIFGR
jgi:protein involved in polysaccharide export with SLBB domain